MFTYIILYFKENLAKNNKIYYFCKHNAKQLVLESKDCTIIETENNLKL